MSIILRLDRKDLHDKWLVESDVKVRARALKNEKKQLGHELKMASKASIMVISFLEIFLFFIFKKFPYRKKILLSETSTVA